jgi:hypothetical protein
MDLGEFVRSVYIFTFIYAKNDEIFVKISQNVQIGIIAQRFICYYSKKDKGVNEPR